MTEEAEVRDPAPEVLDALSAAGLLRVAPVRADDPSRDRLFAPPWAAWVANTFRWGAGNPEAGAAGVRRGAADPDWALALDACLRLDDERAAAELVYAAAREAAC